jgi:hypothetical protein
MKKQTKTSWNVYLQKQLANPKVGKAFQEESKAVKIGRSPKRSA